MIAEKIIRFLKGYLYVRADSRFIERFINICLHRGVEIKDIKRHGNNRITFVTDVKSFLNIRTPARRTKTSVKIIRRCGLPFLIKKYKKKRVVLISSLIVLTIMWYVSNHIIGITVFGNNRIPTEVIMESLKECGLTVGMKTEDVVSDTLRNRMMNKLSDLAWIGINTNGSRVYIEIIERLEKEEGIDKYAPACDLVAKCDGEIERLEIREGQAVVTIGSGVRKGDVLVSGIVDNPISGFDYIHARGDVFAKTRYTKTRAYPLNYIERTETGRKKSGYTLCIGENKISLYKNKPYTSYDTETEDLRLPFGLLPEFSVTREKFVEVNEEKKSITPTEAKSRGEVELLNELTKELGDKAEVIESNVSYTISEKNEAVVTLELICRENIAKEYIIEVPVRE